MKTKLLEVAQKLVGLAGMRLTRKMVGLDREPYLNINDRFDATRMAQLDVLAHEILQRNRTGCVAELGVYKGDFAKKINEAFPIKKLYLFDTFEGFDKADVQKELVGKYSDGNQDFSGTSVEMVLAKMKHPDNCEVRKGFFPDTAKGLEDENFCFVSIDADLYDPIFQGLNYFYPRLSHGGYIMVHDYNNAEYKGAKAAVRDFCKLNEIGYVPITDGWGTAIITKSKTPDYFG